MFCLAFKVTPKGRILVSILALALLASCGNVRKATYFNDLDDSQLGQRQNLPESVVQKGDILAITVTSLNPEATVKYNSTVKVGGADEKQAAGYLVDNSGNIQFPVLGTIKAYGLTKEELRILITNIIVEQKLLLNPIVTVRYLNFRVTVLGEVRNPSVIPVPNERITLLEALGLAGDLTIYAKRDNVLVIREEEGVKVFKRLNLNSDEIFTSPYYYLRSNDVIYVEPNKARIASAGRSQQWIPIALSALSVAIIAADRIK